MHQVIILSLTDHLAAMGDGLHVILIFMTGLVQGILEGEKGALLIKMSLPQLLCHMISHQYTYYQTLSKSRLLISEIKCMN